MIHEIISRRRVDYSQCAGRRRVLYLTLTAIKERYPVSSAGRKEEDESNIRNKYAPVCDLYSVKTERSHCGKKQISCSHNGSTLAK
ncbi:MAG: hypothetical protein LUE11_10750 [Clostridia bacterium]|nr:hypothetical protein [Clostridia bacterium]